MSTPIGRPGGSGHLRGDEQVGPGTAAEVEHDGAGVDAAEDPGVGDAGEAVHGLIGNSRQLLLRVLQLLRPGAAGGEDEVVAWVG